MWVLVDSPNDDFEYICFVNENELGEITVGTTHELEYAFKFETQEDALDFKHDCGLRAWVQQI